MPMSARSLGRSMKWKNALPSVTERAIGVVFRPLGWIVGRLVPPSAIEGGLRAADWLAQQTISEERIFAELGAKDGENVRQRPLRVLDEAAERFHRWAIGYGVAEGAAAGAAGLWGLAVDIPSLITLTLRTVRGIGACYGFTSESEVEREFVLGVLAAASANSVAEKTSALLLLRQIEVTLLRNTFKAMAAKAAEQTLSREAAIIALRDLARQLGINLTKRKMLQVVPIAGAAIGGAVNWKFMDDVAWAARRAYQERWFNAREGNSAMADDRK